MKTSARRASVRLAYLVVLGLLAGFSGSAALSAQTAPAPGGKGQYAGAPQAASYPLDSKAKALKIYMKDSTMGVIKNWGGIKGFMAAEQKLGVDLEFTHPAVGSEADQLNLMIASRNYPDVIIWDFSSTPMGLGELVKDGVLIDMDNYIRQYAPNYLGVLKTQPFFAKEALSDNGHYLAFLSFSEGIPISGGPAIRGDLLKKYGLTVPVTVDDWTRVMTELKKKDSTVQYPLTSGKGRDGSVWFDLILPAYKTAQSFCLDDQTKKVVFGPSTGNFKNYVAKLAEWYKAGLIDPEFMSNDGKMMNGKLANGTCVAGSLQLSYHIMSSTMAARKTNPEFRIEGATWPVMKAGDRPSFAIPNGVTYSGTAIAVTSACKDPVLAVKALDYFYSNEGNTLISWGIEGESYAVGPDGKKTFTDKIMKNPNKKSPQEAILEYAIPLYAFSSVIKSDAYAQMATSLPEQVVARSRWLDAGSGVNMPKLSVAVENQSDYNSIMNEVNTYVQEMYIKFITGKANLSGDWDAYVKTLKGMGLETATKYMADSYKRYQSR